MKIEEIAEICHEVNRIYCKSIGDNSQPLWENAPDWQKESAMRGIDFIRKSINIEFVPERQHNAWLTDKLKDGWKYGTVKDAEKKEHPCILPYNELPDEQKMKDKLFGSIAKYFLENFT